MATKLARMAISKASPAGPGATDVSMCQTIRADAVTRELAPSIPPNAGAIPPKSDRVGLKRVIIVVEIVGATKCSALKISPVSEATKRTVEGDKPAFDSAC